MKTHLLIFDEFMGFVRLLGFSAVSLQSRIIAGSFEGEVTEILKAVNSNIDVLMLLDNYDHQQLSKPDGIEVLNVSVLIFVKIRGYPIRKRNVSGILPA